MAALLCFFMWKCVYLNPKVTEQNLQAKSNKFRKISKVANFELYGISVTISDTAF